MTFDDWTRQGLPKLLRFATVLCGTSHLAEDVVQGVLLKTHRHWDRVQQADRDELITELAKPPRRQRAVLVLRYYGGLSDPEIAETLQCSASTVRAHASRALAALRIEMTATPDTRTGANHAH